MNRFRDKTSILTLLTYCSSVLLIGVLSTTCSSTPDSPEFENPWNPEDSTTYQPPVTTILSMELDGATLDTHSVTISWIGNAPDMEYRRWFDGIVLEPLWSTDTMAEFEWLDEGSYLFEVQGRYNTQAVEGSPHSIAFEIDDIHGPALMFSPRQLPVSLNDQFTIELIAEEVNDLIALETAVQFEPQVFELIEYSVLSGEQDFLCKNFGQVIEIIEPSTGHLELAIGVNNGDPEGVSGSGAILLLTFRADQVGQHDILLSNSSTIITEYLDEDNVGVLVPCQVIVE